GFYDLTIGRKLKPTFGGRELSQLMFLALANTGGQLASLLDINLKYAYIIDTLFNPSFDSTFLLPADAASHNLNLDFPQGFYGGITTAEAITFQAKYPFNSRLTKRADGLHETVYRTGDDELAPGLFAPELGKVVGNLEEARPYLPPNRIQAADLLIQHLRTGRTSAFDSAAAIWRSSSAPLDFILGFADPRFDPLGNKGLWTGLLFVPDDVAQARLDRLREMAGELLAELPEGAAPSLGQCELKAAQLLTAIGANGPLCPDVYCDPPYAKMDSPRQSIIFTNVLVARARAESALEFYASSADSARAVQYAGEIAFVEAALREVLAGNSDELHPDWRNLPDKPPGILAAVQSKLVLLWLSQEPRLISVGLMPDAASQDEAYRRFARQFLSERAQTDLDRGEQARRVIGNFLIASGALKLEKANERSFCQLVDGDLMRNRVMELLQRTQELNRERDRRAASEFIAKYSTLPDNLLPDRSDSHARDRDRRESIERVAFILPLIEADFNPMGGIEDVQLKRPAGFAEEMFLFGGFELKKERP
ncbi:MAG TPA: hypothetical protein VF398_03750, partial [bacterium]